MIRSNERKNKRTPGDGFVYHILCFLNQGHGGRSSLDVSLSGLVDSVRIEESNSKISSGTIISPAKVGYKTNRFFNQDTQTVAYDRWPDELT